MSSNLPLSPLPELPIMRPAPAWKGTCWESIIDTLAALSKDFLIPFAPPVAGVLVAAASYLASDEGTGWLVGMSLVPDVHRGHFQIIAGASLFSALGTLALASIASVLFNRTLSALRRREDQLVDSLSGERNGRIQDRDTLGALVHAAVEGEQLAKASSLTLWKENLRLLLQIIATHYGLGTRDRVSIYIHQHDEFHLLARYSTNPQLSSVRRPTYPAREGCLAQAWEHQAVLERIGFSPDNDEKYNQRQEQLGIPVEEAKRMRMKSRLYAGVRIDTFEPVAVLMFESLDTQGLGKIVPDGRVEMDDSFNEALRRTLRDIDPELIPSKSHASDLEAGVGDTLAEGV